MPKLRAGGAKKSPTRKEEGGGIDGVFGGNSTWSHHPVRKVAQIKNLDKSVYRWMCIHVYTRQNLSRHAVLKKTQPNAYNIYTVWKKSVSAFMPASILGAVQFCRYVFTLLIVHIQYGVWLSKKFLISKFITAKFMGNKV